MALVGRPQGFGSDPPTGSDQARGSLQHVGCANNRVTIGGLVRIEIKFGKCLCTNVQM